MTIQRPDVSWLAEIPVPSYHKLLAMAAAAGRDGKPEDREWAVELLRRLTARFPDVLAIGQELVLILLEADRKDEAETELRQLERRFTNLDEETLCRWGRLFKDRGDHYVMLSWSDPPVATPDPEMARTFYAKSIARYDQAYQVRGGHFPGINKATLLLILGTLKPPLAGAPAKEIAESEGLARALLANRERWPISFDADETLWLPATAGEAYLLLHQWEAATQQYVEALQSRHLNDHARTSMYRQVERIRRCLAVLGVTVPPPLDDPKTFFLVAAPAPPAAAAPAP